jgi:hypothetical protein
MDPISNPDQQTYTVYLYDLPRHEYSSQKIAQIVKEKTGLILDQPPTIYKDVHKKFLSAFMKVQCRNH